MNIEPDYDSPWKEILDAYFDDFVAFFFQAAYAAINWDRGVEFLDKELQKITTDAALGRRYVDKLVKVWLNSGEEFWVMIHVEVQGNRETGFELRIFVYNRRIFERYNAPVASFVILTDDDADWRPTEYRQQVFGTLTTFQFEAVKLLDFEARWEELAANPNVFAVVVMAHLKVISTRKDLGIRLNWKLELTKMLYERGYERLKVLKLLKFLDWLVWLPEELQMNYEDEVVRYEEEKKMEYIMNIERRGMEKGRVEGLVSLAMRQLQHRFGLLSVEIQAGIRALPAEALEDLGEALLDFKDLSDLQNWLDARSEQVA